MVNKRRKKNRYRTAGALALILSLTAAVPANVFAGAPRDIQTHWSGTAVNTLLEHRILYEDSAGRFKPDRPMTRQEAASFVASYIRKQAPALTSGAGISSNFPDLDDGSREAEDAGLLTALGIISGYPDGTFRPTDTLSREAFTSMIYRMEKKVDENAVNAAGAPTETSTGAAIGTVAGPSVKATASAVNTTGPAVNTTASAVNISGSALGTGSREFTDIGMSFAREAILTLTEHNVLHGYPDGTFRPEAGVSRGEAASILYTLSGLDAVPPQAELPKYRVIEVPYISQVYPYGAWVGCEATSLLMGMQGKGYGTELTLKDFLDAMPKVAQNPAMGFAGSPYVPDKEKKVRTTIYPEPLARFASAYGNVSDFSGSSVEELRAEVLSGNPVVVYVTMKWEKPFYRTYEIDGDYQYLLSNNHAVLVCGYDQSTNRYYIADPYNRDMEGTEYKYWIEGGIFEPLYNVRKHALVIE